MGDYKVFHAECNMLQIQESQSEGRYLEEYTEYKAKGAIKLSTLDNKTVKDLVSGSKLKTYEEKILTAEDKIVQIEATIFRVMVEFATDYVETIQQNAALVARLDCLVSFSNISIQNKYTRPVVSG